MAIIDMTWQCLQAIGLVMEAGKVYLDAEVVKTQSGEVERVSITATGPEKIYPATTDLVITYLCSVVVD